jgi:hypothetical protein
MTPEDITSVVVVISMGMTVFYLLLSTVVLPHFNTTYNYTVTGLASATIQGLFLLTFVLGCIGVAIAFFRSRIKSDG